MSTKINKIVLAYSGGLDTSVILRWLKETYDCEVVTFTADIGQGEEVEPAREKAKQHGASEIYIEDLKEEFVRDYVFPMFRANTVYEGTYLLGTAIARPLIAKRQIEIAKETGADAVAHGATGKGNDQVRFELGYYALKPDIKVIAPWREWELNSRTKLLEYAEKHQIPVTKSKRSPLGGEQARSSAKREDQAVGGKTQPSTPHDSPTAASGLASSAPPQGGSVGDEPPYSMDANLLHISYEGRALEDPWVPWDEEMFLRTVSLEQAPNEPEDITIEFERGDAVGVNGEALSPAALLTKLNELGGKHGIGRLDLVENRYVGMKSRGVYETPGGTILLAAHRGIESITLDSGSMHLKDSIMPYYAELIYNGYWFSPERKMLQALIDESQQNVTGTVKLRLFKGGVHVIGRKSPTSLYSEQHVTFEDDQGAYNQQDAEGFIKLNALRLRLLKR